MGYQLEMFPGYEQPRRGYNMTCGDDGEHFDFVCGCGCANHNLAYRLFPGWREADGNEWITYECPNCRTKVNVPVPSGPAVAKA
jgi:hypothetical protein